MSDLYRHYRQLLQDATRYDADRIIEAAFNDYLKDRISYQEYGRIYFAAVDVANGTARKVVSV